MKNGEQPINPIDYDYAQFHGYSLVGLTKREYFAAMVITGKNGNPKEIAEHAVWVADELLKALES